MAIFVLKIKPKIDDILWKPIIPSFQISIIPFLMQKRLPLFEFWEIPDRKISLKKRRGPLSPRHAKEHWPHPFTILHHPVWIYFRLNTTPGPHRSSHQAFEWCLHFSLLIWGKVGPPGIEPGTYRLWAGGSANWAMGPQVVYLLSAVVFFVKIKSSTPSNRNWLLKIEYLW